MFHAFLKSVFRATVYFNVFRSIARQDYASDFGSLSTINVRSHHYRVTILQKVDTRPTVNQTSIKNSEDYREIAINKDDVHKVERYFEIWSVDAECFASPKCKRLKASLAQRDSLTILR